MNKLDLNDPLFVRGLECRHSPYWQTIRYCRHVGIQKRRGSQPVWLGRIRTKKGQYKQGRIGLVKTPNRDGLTFQEALELVHDWFERPSIAKLAAHAFEVGVNMELRFQSSGLGFTVGDAMIDYVAWKRIASTEKNFPVLLSLINAHIIPRIGHLQLTDLSTKVLTEFCRDILETPPRRGNQPIGAKVSIGELDQESLRKRKSTVNTLLGILRVAFRMAWEDGKTDDERCWRRIHRLPNYEAPRQIFLSRTECRTLISNCRSDLADLVRAALYSGCRISELSELVSRDVGKDIFGLFVRTAKSRKSRFIFLPEEGMGFFMGHCSGKHPDELVFRTQQGHKWNGLHKHLFKSAVRASELPEEFVFHGLRHTYASQLVQAGAPLAVVARQLGHSNTDTVSRTYGHLSCSSIERELDLRFAPLSEYPTAPDPSLHQLRNSLQSPAPRIPKNCWPKSNFSSFRGELLSMVK